MTRFAGWYLLLAHAGMVLFDMGTVGWPYGRGRHLVLVRALTR